MVEEKDKDIADIVAAADFLRQRSRHKPSVGIISGTGLECLNEMIEETELIPAAQIPYFPSLGPLTDSTKRAIISGRVCKHHVLLLTKRLHVYEGFSMKQTAFIIRVFKRMGIKIIILTNAAGSLNPLFPPGGIMVITDHINLMGDSPLIGLNINQLGPRFPDMTAPYDPVLIDILENSARKSGIHLFQGVYAGVKGPNLETRAETRFLRMIGSDAVGMSTVPEVIAAVHCGIRVLGLSVLSNINLPDNPKAYTIEDILGVVKSASPILLRLITEFLNSLPIDA